MSTDFETHPVGTAERIKRLEAAITPFARQSLSTEHPATCGIARSPADELRLQASAIERRDAEIIAARECLK